jgi:hypothetical protein
MSTIVWDPNSETDFRNFDTAIHAADEQIRLAKTAIENLYNLNKGLTITALYESFESELFPQWQAHFANLEIFLKQAEASYQAAMAQDSENAGKVSH